MTVLQTVVGFRNNRGVINVLLLIPTLDRSGAEKQFTLLAAGLPRDEFAVEAVALTRGGPYEQALADAGVPVTILHKKYKFDVRALTRLARLIGERKPDILHTWLFAANSYGRLVAGKRPRPKIVVSERCVDSWKSGWQLWLDKKQIGRTARLVGNSNSVADFYKSVGYPDEKVAVIPNGIALSDPPATERAQALAEFNIPADARVIGSVGRLAKQKRTHDLVWGFQLLRQIHENAYMLIVGDGPERRRLEELARHFGCDHLVRFVGHRDDALTLFHLFDVFWLGSDFEGMSNSIMEAMSAGVPVVASDIPPNRELVSDGVTGNIVAVGDSVGFAQLTDRILADREKARAMGDAARERIRTEFSIQKMIDSYAQVYRDVLREAR
jgi:glycosyltransferase involved in cell wall biosynthesis